MPLVITQRETIRSIRKPLPPATRVIVPKRTKVARKRAKRISPDHG